MKPKESSSAKKTVKKNISPTRNGKENTFRMNPFPTLESFFTNPYVVALLVEIIFFGLNPFGPDLANKFYHTFDNALNTFAICNTGVAIWSLIMAVYLHNEIIEKNNADFFTIWFGRFWGNVLRPTVSISLVISSIVLYKVFQVIKMTELKIEDLLNLSS